MIENNDLRRALFRLQLESELVLYRFQKSRPRRIGLQIRNSGLRRLSVQPSRHQTREKKYCRRRYA
jgi:hypothetical protein